MRGLGEGVCVSDGAGDPCADKVKDLFVLGCKKWSGMSIQTRNGREETVGRSYRCPKTGRKQTEGVSSARTFASSLR
jgi:hypothetical protein